jgi:hypothetical protein
MAIVINALSTHPWSLVAQQWPLLLVLCENTSLLSYSAALVYAHKAESQGDKESLFKFVPLDDPTLT